MSSLADTIPSGRLLDAKDLATIYQLKSERVVRELQRAGKLPAAQRIGKHLRWHPDTIRADIERREAEAMQARSA